LTQASYAITEQMYKEAAEAAPEGEGASTSADASKDNGKVVDAEFEENNTNPPS
jgi:hypothetical protein